MTLFQKLLFDTDRLEKSFLAKMEINNNFDRKLVSFQANKIIPEYRWYKYKEGFSASLINRLLRQLGINKGKVIDPFAGVGTTLFVARELGLDSLGIELLPIGCEIIQTRLKLSQSNISQVIRELSRWKDKKPWKKAKNKKLLNHLKITRGAFTKKTEESIEKYLCAIKEEPKGISQILKFALLCILEEISFTRKDGQYLRWDHRSSRNSNTEPAFKIRGRSQLVNC